MTLVVLTNKFPELGDKVTDAVHIEVLQVILGRLLTRQFDKDSEAAYKLHLKFNNVTTKTLPSVEIIQDEKEGDTLIHQISFTTHRVRRSEGAFMWLLHIVGSDSHEKDEDADRTTAKRTFQQLYQQRHRIHWKLNELNVNKKTQI